MLDKFLHFLRRNDKDRALELLYAWLWREVYYAANYILQDRHLAEEVTQETFLAAHRNLERLRDARKVKAWLIQIATHKACNLLRKRKEVEFCDNLQELITEVTPESGMIECERRIEIEKAILNLSRDCQVVVTLKYYLELTTNEIALALGIPEGTVKSRLRKARDLLADMLEKKLDKETLGK